jgi:multidrug efflux pump subunit AcrA (membrane-fusion protein)
MFTKASTWWIVPLLLLAGLALSACSGTHQEAASDPPARIDQILVAGQRHEGVRLTEQAARRLDVQTRPVTPGPAGKLVIPVAAVSYNNDGSAFAYTSPEPLAYVQAPITVDSIAGDEAILSAGPAAGTPVVTVGSAELLGVEVSEFEE